MKNIKYIFFLSLLYFIFFYNVSAYIAYDPIVGTGSTNNNFRLQTAIGSFGDWPIIQQEGSYGTGLCLDILCTQKLQTQYASLQPFHGITGITYPAGFLLISNVLYKGGGMSSVSIVKGKYKYETSGGPYYLCLYDSFNGAQRSDDTIRFYVGEVTTDENFSCSLYNNGYENINLNGTAITTPPTPPTPPPNIPGVTCSLIEVPDLSSTVWWDDFFENEYSATGSGTIYNDNGTVQSHVKYAESANLDFSNYDRFTASDTQYVSNLYTGSLTYPGTIKSNLSAGAGAKDGGFYIASFTSDRNGTRRPWNVLQIFGASTGFFGNFGYFQDFQKRTTTALEYNGSGIVTYLSDTPVRDFAIQAIGGFNGMRIGLAPKTTYYECSASNGNLCELNAISTGSGVECRGKTTPDGIEYGRCAFINGNICSPLTQSGVVVAPLPLPGQAYTIDGSGAVTYTPYYIPGADLNTKGLFDCSYSDWTDSIGCIKEILGNISNAVSKGNESLVGGNNAFNTTLQDIGKNTTGSLDIGVVSATGANMADTIFRGAWNQSMGGDDFFGQIGRFALYGAILLVLLFIILMILSANKK